MKNRTQKEKKVVIFNVIFPNRKKIPNQTRIHFLEIKRKKRKLLKSFACLNFREWAKFAKFLDVVLASVWAPKVKRSYFIFCVSLLRHFRFQKYCNAI